MGEGQGSIDLPGIEAAQSAIIPSYQCALTRYEAADSRLQTFISFVGTVTLGVPAIVHGLSPEKSFHSPWLYAALLLFVLSFTIGTLARIHGSFLLLNPATLYSKWLHYSDKEFKKRLLYHAGRAFDVNVQRINNKASVLTVMMLLFVAEIAVFILWLGL